jgi:hypothetical protein
MIELIGSLRSSPALIYDKHLTVVAANELARAIGPGFAVGSNLALHTFRASQRDENDLPDWDTKHDQIAAILRGSLRDHSEDGEFLDIVGELAATSPEFASSWASDPAMMPTGTFTFVHGTLGKFDLTYHRLSLGNDGDTLVVWRPGDAAGASVLQKLLDSLR